ncbi:MAG: hypothetical protein QOD32_3342 [Pyrinomonadaceae bacterium]|jgi:hypothetical protein|nr:hypothetical protein [Pyrinomonadaceae bacterium]
MFAALVFSSSVVGSFETARAQQTRAAVSAPQGSVIFAVTRRGDAAYEFEPIAFYGRGVFKGSIAGDSSAAELTRFANSYYKAGQRYRLIWGGAEAGTVVAKQSQKATDCSKAAATADVQTSIQLGGNRMALATNSPTLGLAKSSRRAPTDDERAQVKTHVERIFREKGVPAAALDKLKTINLTATDLNNDGAAELIGTYMIKREGTEIFIDQLFVLAEPATGGSVKIAVARHEQLKGMDFTDPESLESVGESAFQTEILLDQLDVDGDGTGEVFTISYSFEGTNYTIYKKGKQGWSAVQEFHNYRCAY